MSTALPMTTDVAVPLAHTIAQACDILAPLAYTIRQSCTVSGLSRSSVYEAIRIGELRAVKRGRRTLILAADLRNWVEGLPALAASGLK
jgi:excisionase family DNA binding protein